MDVKTLLEEMSYKEKSAWVSAGVVAYVLYSYFRDIFSQSVAGELTVDSMKSEYIQVIFITIFLSIVGHVLIAILDKEQAEQKEDERDVSISQRANKVGYNILALVVYIAIFLVWFVDGTADKYQHRLMFEELPVIYNIFNILLVGFLASEFFRYASQVYYYRRGF